MFHVPIEKIKKGNPEYALRQRGKVAELALGYQGGVSAMRRMDTGITSTTSPMMKSRALWTDGAKQIR